MAPGDEDAPRHGEPLDATDPRFGPGGRSRPHVRELVASRGPYPDPESPSARFARLVIPAAALAGLLAVVAVFVAGLRPGSGRIAIGSEDAVRAAVEERPRRACLGEGPTCAWVTLEDGDLVALNTSGPLTEEFGRQGVGWCPTSGGFGANSTGSRYDAGGRVVAGPAPRGLDRFHLAVRDGEVIIDFTSVVTGAPRGHADDLVPPAGQPCAKIPFDRTPPLEGSS